MRGLKDFLNHFVTMTKKKASSRLQIFERAEKAAMQTKVDDPYSCFFSSDEFYLTKQDSSKIQVETVSPDVSNKQENCLSKGELFEKAELGNTDSRPGPCVPLLSAVVTCHV